MRSLVEEDKNSPALREKEREGARHLSVGSLVQVLCLQSRLLFEVDLSFPSFLEPSVLCQKSAAAYYGGAGLAHTHATSN